MQPSDCSLDPLLTHQAYEIHFSQPELECMWPNQTSSTLSQGSDRTTPKGQAGQKRPPCRPKGRSLAAADAEIVECMHRLFRLERAATSPTAAAWTIIGRDGSGARGSGTPDSKVR